MDTMTGRLVERPRVLAQPRRDRAPHRQGVGLVSAPRHIDGAPQRWSPPEQGSGEVLPPVLRPPGRSPVQPLDSFLAADPSRVMGRAQAYGVDRGVRQGLGISANRGVS